MTTGVICARQMVAAPSTRPIRGLGVRPKRSERAGSGQGVILAFAGLCLLVVLGRTWLLAAPGVPAGIDGGSWLTFGRELLGGEMRLGGATYPPLVPLLVTGASGVLGPTLGVALIAAVSASAPAVGVFAVLRWVGLGWGAVALAAPLLITSAAGEVAAWGGYPQLLASPATLVSLCLLDRWLEGGDHRSLVGAVIVGTAVLATSHFGALLAALGGSAILVWRLAASPDRSAVLRRIAAAFTIGLAVSFPLVPTYARLVPAAVGSRATEAALATVRWSELPSRFAGMHGAAWLVWGAGLGAVGAILLRPRRDAGTLRVVAGALVLGLVGTFVLTREPRVLAEVPIAVSVGLAVWFTERPRISHATWRMIASGLTLATALVIAGGVADAAVTRDRFTVLDPPLVEAIEWIESETPPGSVVLVPSVRDAPLGWWVQALAGRPVITGAPLRWLIFAEERELAAEANRLFFVIGMPTEEGMRQAGTLGAHYILLPKGSLAYNAGRATEYLRDDPPAFENAGAIVLVVPDASERWG